MKAWLRRRYRGSDRRRLKLGQAMGAFARPGGDVSPLFVFFEVENAGRTDAGISRIFVTPKGERRPVLADDALTGDRKPPLVLEPGEAARFRVRAKELARRLEDAGHGGRPRVRLVVEDALGNAHQRSFSFRVGQYLKLKDD